jgi:alpha-galactosidase
MQPKCPITLALLLLQCRFSHAAIPFYTPFYAQSANGFTSPARGWNSFGLQAASDKLKHDAGWDFNDYHFRQQCDLIVTQPGFDYYCSIDSGWSSDCNGDSNGIPEVKSSVIPDIQDLANHLHSRGLKLGLYILPGAFSGDANKLVEGTQISIGSLFDEKETEYNCRRAFDYSRNGVQQWHDSVIKKFASW